MTSRATIINDRLQELKSLIESLGFTVSINTKLPVAGRIDYEKKSIAINECRTLMALITLAHEGGHLINFLRNPDLERNRSRRERERFAYFAGWGLLCRLGVARSIITKKTWRSLGIDREYW